MDIRALIYQYSIDLRLAMQRPVDGTFICNLQYALNLFFLQFTLQFDLSGEGIDPRRIFITMFAIEDVLF